MSAERLLAQYEKIADAPDAIAQLRRFVLDLAVRGKLVPQDPYDEPASELLKRIAKENGRLVTTGEIKKASVVADLTVSNHGLSTPNGWVITNIQSVFESVTDGDHLPPPKADAGIPFLVIGNVRSQRIDFAGSRFVPSEYYEALDAIRRPKKGDPLYTLVGSYGIPVIVRDDRPFCVQRHIGILRPSRLVDVIFFARAMESQLAFDQATACATGIAQKTVPLSGLRKLLIPLPPLAEQLRIAAKVDELMSLCDRLEAARGSREAVRDRLAAASLARLNAPDPETFQADARFALDVLPALTTRPDQIEYLRQTILNLAVRGKLVPQDPNDEPASELLRRIAKEIAAYGKANRIGQSNAEPIPADDLPFSAPHGWQWTRLCALFKVITDGDHQPPPRADEGVAFLTIGNITTGRLDFSGCRLVPESYFKSLAAYRTPAKGDILYTVVGATYGRPAVVDADRGFCVQRHIAILKPVETMSLRFLVTLLASPLIYDQATRSTTGTAQPTIALRPLRNFLAPLPPLAEQRRIVAKVDALMALCDRLEASLTATAATRRRLLDALLAEALAPVADRAMEAAE